jgi:hypothetical protein
VLFVLHDRHLRPPHNDSHLDYQHTAYDLQVHIIAITVPLDTGIKAKARMFQILDLAEAISFDTKVSRQHRATGRSLGGPVFVELHEAHTCHPFHSHDPPKVPSLQSSSSHAVSPAMHNFLFTNIAQL